MSGQRHMSAQEYREVVAGQCSEREFTTWLVQLADSFGWWIAHFRPARTEVGWRTPMQGDAGYPDITLARSDRGLIIAELKSSRGRLSPRQKRWLAELSGMEPDWWKPGRRVDLGGLVVACWTPANRAEITELLSS